jgi:membrane-bound inhibitor of C-type lysozyme
MSPGLETVVLPTVIDYMCEGAQPMRVERAGDARSATVSFASRSWTLARAESAAQEKYAEGTTALYLDGEIAMLESDGRVLGGQCQSKTPMPRAPAMRPYQF